MKLNKPQRFFVIALSVSISSMIFLSGCSQAPVNNKQTAVLQAAPAVDLFVERDVTAVQAVPETGAPESSEALNASAETALAAPAEQPAAQSSQTSDAPAALPGISTPVENAPAAAQPPAEVSSAAVDAAIGAVPTTVEPTVGSLAPDFTLKTLDGQPVSLSGLRGQNVLINYWVTWCVPCLQEMPALEKLYAEYKDKGLVILSVNGIAQDEMAKVTETVADLGLTYPVVLDENDAVYKSYWLGFMPTSVFVDDQGVIRFIKFGSASEEEFRAKIEQLLSNQL